MFLFSTSHRAHLHHHSTGVKLLILQSRRSRQKHQNQVFGTKSVQIFCREFGSRLLLLDSSVTLQGWAGSNTVLSIKLSELASKLVCVRSNVTQLVDRLETEGLVKRADDPADRRAVRAEVTALGRKRQAAGTPVVNAVLQDVANKLAAVDSQKLKRALDAIQ